MTSDSARGDEAGGWLAVYGASGLAGSALSRALAGAGAKVRLVGRQRALLERVRAELPADARVEVRVADAADRAALVAAFVGARVVVNAAGPYARLGDAVVASAVAAGCHYLDLCAEQAVLRHQFEAFDAAARHAGLAVVPGAGFAPALGDLLAATAAARLFGVDDEGPTVRETAGRRLGGEQPLAIAVAYLFDDLALSPGAQASVFANLHAPAVAWRKDRWDSERPGRRERGFTPGAGPSAEPSADEAPSQAAGAKAAPARHATERRAFSIGGGDNVTIPRHVAATSVDTYVSLGENAHVQRALRLTALAASLLPAAAASLLVPIQPHASDYAATRYAVMAVAEHPFASRHAVVHGRDLYSTSTAITTRLALGLASRRGGAVGVLAPSEIVRAPAFLSELARAGVLALA